MTGRRAFLRTSLGAAAGAVLAPAAHALPAALPAFRPRALALAADLAGDGRDAEAVARDEDFWTTVQRAFDVDRTLVNLNNGGVSPTPTHVLDAMMRDLRFSNGAPVYEMWQVLEPRVESGCASCVRGWRTWRRRRTSSGRRTCGSRSTC